MPGLRILIVVPCLNEEESLPALAERLRDAMASRPDDSIEVVVVDDGSLDRTAELARANGLRVARLPRNLGIGGAVQTGLRLALRENHDCAIQIDGDGQHPPSEIGKLLAPLEAEETRDVDLIVGSRFVDAGGDGWRSTRMRRLGIRWLSFILRFVAGVRITDPTSGFRVYGRRALALFADNYPYDFPEPESLALARAAGLRILEVPVTMQARQGGVSSIRGVAAVYYMLKVTLAVFLTFVRGKGSVGRARRDG